jgi:hypothetical protein
MLEKEYYKQVATFAEKKLGCFDSAVNKGLRHGRVDVVGLRNSGGFLRGDTELIGIEVKRGNQPFLAGAGQASSYSIYVERSYLADVRDDGFTQEEKEIASKLNIGLIAISGTSRLRVTEVQTAPRGEPLPQMKQELMEKIGYVMCTLCNSPFPRGSGNNWDGLTKQSRSRDHVTKALESERGVYYFLEGQNELHTPHGDWVKHRRYLCWDCLRQLYP